MPILRGLEVLIRDILDTIMGGGFLGELDGQLYVEYLQRKAKTPKLVSSYSLNPNFCLDKRVSWGFWLPRGLLTNDPIVIANAFDARRKCFNALERYFRDWCGLTQKQLPLGEEQTRRFNK